MAQFEVKRSTGAVALHNVFEPDSLSKVQNGIYNISNTYPFPRV